MCKCEDINSSGEKNQFQTLTCIFIFNSVIKTTPALKKNLTSKTNECKSTNEWPQQQQKRKRTLLCAVHIYCSKMGWRVYAHAVRCTAKECDKKYGCKNIFVEIDHLHATRCFECWMRRWTHTYKSKRQYTFSISTYYSPFVCLGASTVWVYSFIAGTWSLPLCPLVCSSMKILKDCCSLTNYIYRYTLHRIYSNASVDNDKKRT